MVHSRVLLILTLHRVCLADPDLCLWLLHLKHLIIHANIIALILSKQGC